MSGEMMWLIDILVEFKYALLIFISLALTLGFFFVLIGGIFDCCNDFEEKILKVKKIALWVLIASALCVIIPSEETLYTLLYEETQDIIVLEVE